MLPIMYFNMADIGDEFMPHGSIGLIAERCRKANHYWKRYGRRFAVVADGNDMLIKRVK